MILYVMFLCDQMTGNQQKAKAFYNWNFPVFIVLIHLSCFDVQFYNGGQINGASQMTTCDVCLRQYHVACFVFVN